MKTTKENEEGEITSGTNMSYWLDSTEQVAYDGELKDNQKTDVVIVGAVFGMA